MRKQSTFLSSKQRWVLIKCGITPQPESTEYLYFFFYLRFLLGTEMIHWYVPK